MLTAGVMVASVLPQSKLIDLFEAIVLKQKRKDMSTASFTTVLNKF